MKKVTGYVDEFRRATIIEKLPKKYFFEMDDKPDKVKYIRKRGQPAAPQTMDDVPTHREVQAPFQVSSIDNHLVKDVSVYHQPKRAKGYQEMAQETQKKAGRYSEFSNKLIDKTATVNEYSFGAKKYKAPPRTFTQGNVDEKDKEKPMIRKALEQEEEQYDFFKLNKELHQKFADAKFDATFKGSNGTEKYESATYPKNLREIEEFREMPEMQKNFSYMLDPITIEEQLQHIYRMQIKEESLVLGISKHKAFQINYMRELGSISRRPVGHTVHLLAKELVVVPSDMKFHDILNIASSRLDHKLIANCVRTKGISKQEFLNAQRVYDKLKKEEKVLVDAQIECGEQMVQQDFYEEKEEEETWETETEKCINEITELKFQIGRIKSTAASPHQFAEEVEKRLKFLLNIIFKKIVDGTNVLHPTLEYLKKNVEGITGKTQSGYDRKRLLWLYSDSVALFKTTVQGENIKNLMIKSTNQKGVVTTVYKHNGNKMVPSTRQIRSKSILQTKTQKKSLTPPK